MVINVTPCIANPMLSMFGDCALLNLGAWTKYVCTYLLTPWSRIPLEKLTDCEIVKKFPAFYGT